MGITIKVWADLTFLSLHDNQVCCRGNVLNKVLDIKHVLISPKINNQAQQAEFNLDMRRKLKIALIISAFLAKVHHGLCCSIVPL